MDKCVNFYKILNECYMLRLTIAFKLFDKMEQSAIGVGYVSCFLVP